MTAKRIIEQIFQQPELDRVSIVTLEGVVDEFPYFTAARLLLAQKNYEQYPNLHSPAVKKAQLYTNNPHYFFQFLTGELKKNDTGAGTYHYTPSPGYTPSSDYTPSPIAAAPVTPPAPVEKQPLAPNWEAITRRESEGELDFMIREREEIRAAIKRMEAREKEEEEQQAKENGQLTVDSGQPEAAAGVDNEHLIVGSEQVEQPEEPAPQAESFEEEALEEPITYASSEVEDSWEFTVGNQQPDEPVNHTIEPVTEELADTPEAAPEEVKEPEKETAAPAAELPVNQATVTAAEEPIKIYPLEIPEEETTLTFQPLYTDDYFAYKRLQEPGSADELNEKGMADMRSFTDWLREMKQSFAKKADKDWYHQQLHRIYVDDDPEVSEAVEKMAMESITLNDDIVSETLAEIWARQRQYQTAIQIYQKLSLLNPNKSAYFAQKIQELQLAQSEANKS
ncbi:MAG TPA: hypothetical protein VGE90_06180 [Chitinophaga sp.]